MDQVDKATAIRLIAFVCAAQVLVQIGAFFWPALVPEMMARWRLTNSEAGWITAAFYGAYMLAVPVLVTLTDRLDTRRVYLGGVAAMVARARAVCRLGGRLLVRLRGAQPDRHRLGRNLHDRPQAARRQGGRQNAVARCGRARREHRHLRRALLCVRRSARARRRLALRLRGGGLQRRGRVAHHRARGAAPGAQERTGTGRNAVRLPARAAQSLRDGLRGRLWPAYARDGGAARLGRRVPRQRRGEHRRRGRLLVADRDADRPRADRHAREPRRQRGRDPVRPSRAGLGGHRSDRSRSPHCSPRSVRAPTRSPLRSCWSTAR